MQPAEHLLWVGNPTTQPLLPILLRDWWGSVTQWRRLLCKEEAPCGEGFGNEDLYLRLNESCCYGFSITAYQCESGMYLLGTLSCALSGLIAGPPL